METAHPTLTFALALVIGVLAQSLARHIRIPGIVLLLLAGMALGPDGLGWVRPRDLGGGLYGIVELAVSVILFEGGLNLQASRIRREQSSIRRLVTWGAIITLIGAAACAHLVLGWDIAHSAVFGSLVVVTGPTVIGPLVAELRLKHRVATVLEAEGVLIDPIGVILAALVLELVMDQDMGNLAGSGLGLIMRLSFGALAGVVGGLVLGLALRVGRLVPEGHENILVLASVLVLFEGSESLVTNSGILAVTTAGIVVGNMSTPVSRDLREFKDQLSVMLIGLLFIMLAADVSIEQVQSLGRGGLVVVALLVLVVRPLGVFFSTMRSDLSPRERIFVAWIAPRGIVAAAMASLVASSLENEGIVGGLEVRALVFLTIAVTVVLVGLTAGPVARLLDVRLPGREGVAILGANALGVELARALRSGGAPVIFLDSNPQHCRAVEEAGFQVIFGNAIQERTMQRARFETVKTVVALTGNKTLNGVFISRARQDFGVPRGLAAVDQDRKGLVAEMMGRGEVDIIFDAHHDLERWDVRARRGDLETARCRYRAPDEDAGARSSGGERFVILAIARGSTVLPMSLSLKLQEGDEAIVAVHTPEREDAFRALEAQGWWAMEEETEADGAERTPEAG